MDTTNPPVSPYCLSPAELASKLAGAKAPLVIDVRKPEPYAASTSMLPGALRRDPLQVGQWAATLPSATPVLVYCALGHEVGLDTMTVLRQCGIEAYYLQGGIKAWRTEGRSLAGKPKGGGTRWVTRERPKIDRIACPWLIRRFVDADAEFLYVPTGQVRETAETQFATAYDVGPQVAATAFTHVGELCSFDAFVSHYRLGEDAALVLLASTVRAADTDRLDLAPQAAGLLAVSLGMSRLYADDHAMLEAMMPVYDALYAWCRDAVAGQDEKHNWKPQGTAA